MASQTPAAVVLEGEHVRLEPLEDRHAPDLAEAAAPPEIWRWLGDAPPEGGDADAVLAWTHRWIAWSHRCAERSGEVVFATVRRGVDSGRDRAVGSTRFMAVRPEHGGVEIGWTWLTPSAQRTPVNTEAKLVMLTHAFEGLGMRRVELKTDALNARSRAAILRIGATFEGILRHHVVRRDGSMRDSAYYSILADEWPGVRDRLRARLDRRHGS